MKSATNVSRLHARGFRVAVAVALAGGMTAAMLGAAASTAAAAPGGTEYVNNAPGVGMDTGSCRLAAHPCQTITYAINVDPSPSVNTTIHVAAGSYPEQLTISSDVTIVGSGISNTKIDPSSLPASDTDSDSATPQFAIVDVTDGATASLEKLTVDGSQATAQFDTCANDFVGVYYHNASGTIENVDVENIVLPQADFGCQDGLGIYVATDAPVGAGWSSGASESSARPLIIDGAGGARLSPLDARGIRSLALRPKNGPSPSSNVTMTDVSVTNYDKNGITCDDPGTTCSITGSTTTGIGPTSLIGQNGIQGYDAGSLTLKSDTVTGNTYTGDPAGEGTGVLLIDQGTLTVKNCTASSNDYNFYLLNDGYALTNPGSWSITGSTATNSTYGDGIAIDSVTNSLTVDSNEHVRGNMGNGIALYGTAAVDVQANTANLNGANGIYVGGPGTTGNGSSANIVNGNSTSNNANDGILADSDATSGTFTGNKAVDNILYDYQDSSSGNTNSWLADTCSPPHDSNPAGLCSHA
jgi:hypothetical protein